MKNWSVLVTFWRLRLDSSSLCLVPILLGDSACFISNKQISLLECVYIVAYLVLPRILSSRRIKHDITMGALGLHRVKSHYMLLGEELTFFPRTLVYSAINNRQANSGLNHKEFMFHLTRTSGSKSPGVLMAQRCAPLLLPQWLGFLLKCVYLGHKMAASAQGLSPLMTLYKAGRERRGWYCFLF